MSESADQPQAYFEFLGTVEVDTKQGPATFERFLCTELAHGAWGPFQHGAPPAALLTRALERGPGSDSGMRTTRIAVDLLGQVPYTEIRTRSWVSRPGRQIQKIEGEILAEDKNGNWRAVASGAAWQMSTIDTSEIERAFDRSIPGPDECNDEVVPLKQWPGGFISSVEARSGEDKSPVHHSGPGTRIHWVRTPYPIVEGEVPTPIEYLMQLTDTANGIGATLDYNKWAFMNTDLVVHIHRQPNLDTTDRWIGISARGSVGPDGIGMTSGELYDEYGPIGRSVQTLLVRPQAAPLA
ncbi:thioesterase family protein [Corynebacterium sp. H113]|uniref:thioesterase family protein n=1 Tax=Corynebacterium sp. H113 TaxID=3133419 RepID=UPI0030A56B81